MTTVWRPHVRREIPNSDDAKVEVEVPEEVNKGVKRKRAPPTKGPCEHGVKYRSNCKVCRACPHGRQRANCKECGGTSICEHGRQRTLCKECGGSGICEHGRQRPLCKECGGASICEHGRVALSMQGVRWCINLRARSSSALSARSAVGHAICEHGRRRSTARSAVGHQSASTVVGASMQGVSWCINLNFEGHILIDHLSSSNLLPRQRRLVVVGLELLIGAPGILPVLIFRAVLVTLLEVEVGVIILIISSSSHRRRHRRRHHPTRIPTRLRPLQTPHPPPLRPRHPPRPSPDHPRPSDPRCTHRPHPPPNPRDPSYPIDPRSRRPKTTAEHPQSPTSNQPPRRRSLDRRRRLVPSRRRSRRRP